MPRFTKQTQCNFFTCSISFFKNKSLIIYNRKAISTANSYYGFIRSSFFIKYNYSGWGRFIWRNVDIAIFYFVNNFLVIPSSVPEKESLIEVFIPVKGSSCG
jgi:hypothetical protein